MIHILICYVLHVYMYIYTYHIMHLYNCISIVNYVNNYYTILLYANGLYNI